MHTSTRRVVVVGANGQLGRALTDLLPDATPVDRPDIDITDRDSVERFDWSGAGTVYNAAGYTAVDKAEDDRAAAWAVNATGPANLARAASEYGFTLVHVSTDYVFDGTRPGPIPEDAPFAPLGVYGASKAAGELAVAAVPRHAIARTTWLIGDGHNFVRTMLELARRGVRPSVVGDQIGRPTFAVDLARALTALAEEIDQGAAPGIYNVTNDGPPVSWADIARAVFRHADREADAVTDVTTAEYTADKPHMADRPSNSVLDLGKLNALGIRTPEWTESLSTYMDGNA